MKQTPYAKKAIRIARHFGSKATTAKGAARYLLSILRDVPTNQTVNLGSVWASPAQIKLAFKMRAEYPPPRPNLTQDQREDRRAANDPKFRRKLIRNLKSQLRKTESDCHPGNYGSIESEVKRLTKRILSISPNAKVTSLFSIIPGGLYGTPTWLGFNQQCKEATWNRGMVHGVESSPPVVEWKNGSPRTIERAKRITTIATVKKQAGKDTHVFLEGTKRRVELVLANSHPDQVSFTGALEREICVWHTNRRATRYSLTTKKPTGVAVRVGDHIDHGVTVREAFQEIRHKIRIEAKRQAQERATRKEKRKAILYAAITHLKIDFDVARSYGACVPGITSWCASRGLDTTAAIPAIELARDENPNAQSIARKHMQTVYQARLLRGT